MSDENAEDWIFPQTETANENDEDVSFDTGTDGSKYKKYMYTYFCWKLG